jgi:hypothetical protein
MNHRVLCCRTIIHDSRCSSGVERFLGKEKVRGSIPLIGSKKQKHNTHNYGKRII